MTDAVLIFAHDTLNTWDPVAWTLDKCQCTDFKCQFRCAAMRNDVAMCLNALAGMSYYNTIDADDLTIAVKSNNMTIITTLVERAITAGFNISDDMKPAIVAIEYDYIVAFEYIIDMVYDYILDYDAISRYMIRAGMLRGLKNLMNVILSHTTAYYAKLIRNEACASHVKDIVRDNIRAALTDDYPEKYKEALMSLLNASYRRNI